MQTLIYPMMFLLYFKQKSRQGLASFILFFCVWRQNVRNDAYVIIQYLLLAECIAWGKSNYHLQ